MLKLLLSYTLFFTGASFAMAPQPEQEDPCLEFRKFTVFASGYKKFNRTQLDEALQKAKAQGCHNPSGLVPQKAVAAYEQAGAKVDCKPRLKHTYYIPGCGAYPVYENLNGYCRYEFNLSKGKS